MRDEKSIGLKIFLLVIRPLQRLPLKFHYFCGSVFSFIAKKLLRYRKDVVMTNLSRSFPDKKYKELTDISDGFYRHLGEIFAEAIWFGGCYKRPGRLNKKHLVEIENPQELIDTYDSSKSVMILDSHFGNWELLGGMFQYIYNVPQEKITLGENDVCVVYKELSSKFWDGFFKTNRCAALNEDYYGCLESRQVIRYALAHQKEKKVYIFPTDQFPYRGAAKHFVPSFMNQPTYVMAGGAALASKLDMAVMCSFMRRESKGHYKVKMVKICDNASALSAEEIMINYYSLLENEINNNPENYLWSHKRWK